LRQNTLIESQSAVGKSNRKLKENMNEETIKFETLFLLDGPQAL